MTSRDFCYWLQGFFEVQGLDSKVTISDGQARLIRAHLNLVFNHEIDPENFKNKTMGEIKVYDEIHKGADSTTKFVPPAQSVLKPVNPSILGIKKSDEIKQYFNDNFDPSKILEVRYNC